MNIYIYACQVYFLFYFIFHFLALFLKANSSSVDSVLEEPESGCEWKSGYRINLTSSVTESNLIEWSNHTFLTAQGMVGSQPQAHKRFIFALSDPYPFFLCI